MKLSLLTFALTFPLPICAIADEFKSVVRFVNNDQLSGRLESLSTDRLIWKSPILEAPASFFLKSVLDLNLAPEHPIRNSRYEALLTLTNGDTVNGQLLAVSDETVELDTWFAGNLKFRRVMVKAIEINERPSFIYHGPTGIEDWTQSSDPPDWSYQNSALISSAASSVAKDVNLPDECCISFEAAWRGSFGLKFFFFSDQLKAESPPNGYEISFQQRAIFARSCKTGATLGPGGTAPVLQENEKAKIEVRASLKSGSIAVFVNGEIFGAWTDPDMAQNKVGRGIHFVTINSSPVRISQIGVGLWDGVIDEMPEPQRPGGFRAFEGMEDEPSPPAAEKVDEGNRMILRNGDSIAGEVLGINDDIVTIKTPFKDVKVPVAVLKSVALKPADLERCKRENGDVRAWFPDGTSLVFRLESITEKTITGYNQNFGTADFKIAAFSRIEFNIYDRKLEDLRVMNNW